MSKTDTEQITPAKVRQKILRLLKLMKSTLYLQSDQNAETAENATTQAEQLLRKTASKALSEAAYKCESLFELVEYAHELLDFEKWE